MQKTQIDPNQINMFDNTMHGFVPHIEVKYHGKYIKTEKHQRHFRGQAAIMLRDYCSGEFWTTQEWRNNTGFSEACRILRRIARGEYKGYGREEIEAGEHHAKYRIVKLD